MRLARVSSLTGILPVMPYLSGSTIAGQMKFCSRKSALSAFASDDETTPVKEKVNVKEGQFFGRAQHPTRYCMNPKICKFVFF